MTEERNYYKTKQDKGKRRYDLIPMEFLTKVIDEYVPSSVELFNQSYSYLPSIVAVAIVATGGYTNFLEQLALVYEYGCRKYTEGSWISVPNGADRYRAAAMRHYAEFKKGNYVNHEEDSLLHIAQAAWNVIAAMWHEEYGYETDNDTDSPRA